MRRQLSENFYQDEFDCPCCGKNNIHPDIVDLLQKLRYRWGRPIRITSGCRCDNHNQDPKVGGKPGSDHVLGYAVDIDCVNALDRRELVRLALEVGIPVIGVKHDCLHLSCGSPARLFTYDLPKQPTVR